MNADQSLLRRAVESAHFPTDPTLFKQGILYAAVGVLNTLLGFSLIALALAFGYSDIASNVTGYIGALALSYTLNRNITFQHKGSHGRSLWSFCIIVAIAYLANLGVLLVAHRQLHLNVYIAQAMAIVVYAAIGFLGSRYIAFSRGP